MRQRTGSTRRGCYLATRGSRRVLGVLVVSALLGAGAANAAIIPFAGSLTLSGEVKLAGDGATGFTITYASVQIKTGDRQATISIEQTITAARAGEAVGLIPLPDGADTSTLTVVQKTGDLSTNLTVRCLAADAAKPVLEKLAADTRNAAVLAWSGRGIALVSGLQLGREKTDVTIRYTQSVPSREGLVLLRCPMPAAHLSAQPLARLSVQADIETKEPLRTLFSPSHPCTIERPALRQAIVRASAEAVREGDDFQLCYVAASDPMGLRVLTHRPKGQEDGFFLLIGNPTGSDSNENSAPKDVIFALDISGSMRGEKMEQARTAIEYCLDRLGGNDRFNIVTFGTDVKEFKSALALRTAASIKEAKTFLDELAPSGRTNIRDALAKGLAGAHDPKRPRLMLFLTDGTPTAGERAPKKILEIVRDLNSSKTRVFVMGLGHDVNAHLLDGLAEATDGSSEYVEPSEEIDVKVASLYNRLSAPFLMNARVDFGELKVSSVFPTNLPALFKGTEVMIAGRFRNSGTHTLAVRGSLFGQDREYKVKADFPAAEDRGCQFVAPIWAARKIGFYLQEIRLHGPSDELIQEVTRLSKEYGIITEYTSYLADARPAPTTVREMMDETRGRMQRANAEQSGAWAFNQARNDADLKSRVVASKAANTFRSRGGEVKEAENIAQVEGQAFYARDGKWEDAEEQGDRKVRKVKKFSKEYFELVGKDEKFKRAQTLNGTMSINVGEERIEVGE